MFGSEPLMPASWSARKGRESACDGIARFSPSEPFGAGARAPAHRKRRVAIGPRGPEALDESLHVARSNQETVDTVGDALGAASCGRGDDRSAAAHCLLHHQAETVAQR